MGMAGVQWRGLSVVRSVWHGVPGMSALENPADPADPAPMTAPAAPPALPALRLRIVLGDGAMIGPGKADLLAGIARTGSIAAAGRGMGMSYKRAWMLVEALNAMFGAPLVDSARGGSGGGHAALTELGAEVLALYRRAETAAAGAAADDLARLSALRADMSGQK
jgi:molybdate transport system regulatory protein